MIELTIKVPELLVPEIKNLAEKLAGMVNDNANESFLTMEEFDWCVAAAIRTLKNERLIRSSRDYAWIMKLLNEQYLDDFEQYYTGLSFIEYLNLIGVKDRPSKSAIYNNYAIIIGEFPKWEFSDEPEHSEAVRRINVGKRFINAYMRAKKAVSEGFSEL